MPPKSTLNLILTTILTVAVSVATLVITSKFTGPLPLSLTQTISQKETPFSVTGQSEIITIPDQAQVSLGIDIKQSTVAQAQAEANQVMSNIKQELTDLGIENKDIKTQNYSIYPEYDYRSSERAVTGYRVNATLQVKLTEFDKLNQAIDLGAKNGANQIGSINFSISTVAEKELKKQARQEAIADAKDSARELAELAGIQLGRIIDIQEGRDQPSPLYRTMEALPLAGGGAQDQATQVEPGSATYNYTVTLSYETL